MGANMLLGAKSNFKLIVEVDVEKFRFVNISLGLTSKSLIVNGT
jgi:hypothetical protein